jgi:L-lactate dehydrogenase (cytochrome)
MYYDRYFSASAEMSTIRELKPSLSAAEQEAPRLEVVARPARKTPRSLRHILSLEDLEGAARRVLPRPIFGYVSGGSEGNASLRGNRSAFDEIAFVPRVLVDVRSRSLKTTLFGKQYSLPFGFAPMGGTSVGAYQGDVVLARVAGEVNIPMIQSGASLAPLERVKEAGRTAWFQAYLPGDLDIITPLVERAQRAGFETLVLTVDVPVMANRENNVRSGYSTPLRPTPRMAWDCMIRPKWLFGTLMRTVMNEGMPHFQNMGDKVPAPLISRTAVRGRAMRDGLSWQHVEHMRRIWKGNLVLKGLLHPEDARIARESGVNGVMVSNHGGRQLDGTIAPLRMLPGVADQAGGMTVMMDSGIRRGTDVLKALALGAQFVFIGRPWLYAASIAGDDGVHHAVGLLRDEIDRDMAMLGINGVGEMNRELLKPAHGSIV